MLLQKTCHDGLLTRCRASADMSFFGKKASARDVRHPGQGSSRYLMKMAHIPGEDGAHPHRACRAGDFG